VGGDEFTVLLWGCGQPEAGRDVAEMLQESLRRALHPEGIPLHAQASMGLAVAPAQAATQADLIFAGRTPRCMRRMGAEERLVVSYLGAMVVASFALLDPRVVRDSLGRLLWAAVQCTIIHLVLSYSTQRRLQPWCPLRQGGEDEAAGPDITDPLPKGFSLR